MRRTLTLTLLAVSTAFAQSESNHIFISSGGIGGGLQMSDAPVQGAPYSATITNESVQTLADGNRIVQTSSGTTARDSMGRTRKDATLPLIGNMSPADAPHLVFVQDPVAQTSYTLNLKDKTAVKNPSSSGMAQGLAMPALSTSVAFSGAIVTKAPPPQTIAIQSRLIAGDEGQAQTEQLGSKTMEGVTVTGTRTTHTIPAGQIGNDRPLSIVTEVWTSPELKTVIYSKRSDPRMGDQTFQVTNIVRAEPDPSLFMVPSDFKILDVPGPIVYKTSGPSDE
jgi:hypothetical protein